MSRFGRGGRLGEEGRRSLGSVSCEVVCVCGSGGRELVVLEEAILVSWIKSPPLFFSGKGQISCSKFIGNCS